MKKIQYPGSPLRLLFLTSALLFFYGFLMGGQQLVISDIAGTFGLSEVGMGALVSSEFAAVILMPLLMGAIAQRVGNKAVLMAFTMVYCCGCVMCGAAPFAYLYAAGAFVMGCGHSVCESTGSAAVLDLDSVKGMRYMNMLQCALAVGAITSPPLVRLVREKTGVSWRYLFFFCAIVFCLLFLLAAGTAFPDRPSVPEGGEAAGSGWAYGRKVPAVKPFLPFLICIILYVGLECGFGYFVGTLFSDGMGSSLGAAAISVYWMGMALSRLVFSAVNYRPLKTLRTAFACCGILLAALACSPGPAAGVMICALIGASYGPVWTTLATMAVRTDPGRSSFIMGVMSMGGGAGGVVFPLVMGRLTETFAVRKAFGFLVMTAIICMGICLMVKNRQGKENV